MSLAAAAIEPPRSAGCPAMTASSQPGRLRLTGTGAHTLGLDRVLAEGDTVVIGRHRDCTLVCRTPTGGREGVLVSRQHAVVERRADGVWCVYDSGSANGTLLLRGGRPPSVPLEAGVPYAINPGDVIELAGSDDYQFAVERMPDTSEPAALPRGPDTRVDPETVPSSPALVPAPPPIPPPIQPMLPPPVPQVVLPTPPPLRVPVQLPPPLPSATPVAVVSPAPPALRLPAHTEHLIASQQATLQVLHQGKAIQAVDVEAGGLTITGPGLPPAPGHAQLALAGLAPSVYATIRLEPSDALLRTEDYAVHQNLEPVAAHALVPLKDKDLLTIPDAPDVSMLFLDPRRIPERNLSDLFVHTDRLTIGTAASNTCRLIDPSLSRVHAEIWRDRGELFVRDLGSRNGTAIDGRRVHGTVERLVAGHRLTLGRLPFRVDAAAVGVSAAPPPLPSVDVRVVEVSADIAGKRRLHGVSIGVGQGEMVGLLGPSASGKSTLLKVLAGEQPIAGGELYVNGRSMRQNAGRWSWFTSLMGYRGDDYEVGFVQQIDLIQPDLTVREVLEYAARHMGLPGDVARQRATDAAALCNLGPLMDRVALLGNGRMNLSGGQLKRVCVAVEILRQPRILLLDEPTTGQDPKNTDDLMKLFRSVAQRGVTLLMSTHDLRNLVVFDKVAALCLGRLVYFGPPTEFADYFGTSSPEEVYDSLPDREDREAEAEALAIRFRQSPHYRRYCEALP